MDTGRNVEENMTLNALHGFHKAIWVVDQQQHIK
jgi:hypothetical protein